MTIQLDVIDDGNVVLPLSKYELFRPPGFDTDTPHPELYKRDTYPFVREETNQQGDNESEGGERGDPREVFYSEGDFVGQVAGEPDLEFTVSVSSDFDPNEPLTPSLGTPEPGSPELDLSDDVDRRSADIDRHSDDNQVSSTTNWDPDPVNLVRFDSDVERYQTIPEEIEQLRREWVYDIESEYETSTTSGNNNWRIGEYSSLLERISARRSAYESRFEHQSAGGTSRGSQTVGPVPASVPVPDEDVSGLQPSVIGPSTSQLKRAHHDAFFRPKERRSDDSDCSDDPKQPYLPSKRTTDTAEQSTSSV